MSRFFSGTLSTGQIEKATTLINQAIQAMNPSSVGQPTVEQILNFAGVFTRVLYETGGPFQAMLTRGKNGPVDPIEFDFLKVLAIEYLSMCDNKDIPAAPVSYYKELLCMDDVDDVHEMVLNKEDIEVLTKMLHVDPAHYVSTLMRRRSLSDVVCIAKILFGDVV